MSAVSELRDKYLAAVEGAGDEAALEQVRLAALGKKGEVSALMRSLGAMSAEERQTTGATLNECARVLKKAGARTVWAVTVGRG